MRSFKTWNGKSARKSQRAATKAGLVVEERTDLAAVEEFFRLHVGVRKGKYRMLAQPFAFFDAIWRRFIQPGDGVVLLARQNDALGAAHLHVRDGDTLYYKFSASDPEMLSLHVNDFLIRAAVLYASRSRLSAIDLGVSDLNQPGLISFKEKYSTAAGRVLGLDGTG